MNSNLIRSNFIKFFEEKSHSFVQSSSIVAKNDPTLMFTNAGMNQFKNIFLGNESAKIKRVVNSQKCLRVSGKHNDLEEVGIDHYHHTMFEMLGNWSFGDYFKKEIINWSLEILTKVYKLSKDDLYDTVFEGNEDDKLDKDVEAYNFWSEIIDEDKIVLGDKKDNFWEMGDTGPCGPCSEIHIDLRSKDEKNKISGSSLVNTDHPEVIELWNLVFIQFNRKSDGKLEELPNKHIDTGMGFERLARIIQKKESNYDTDIFAPLITEICNITGLKYGRDSKIDTAFRVIVDHVRAVSFCIADGQIPGNSGSSYVIRRILRRAIRYGYTFLNQSKPFIFKLVNILSNQFADHFNELLSQKELIESIIKEEEKSFLRTLQSGIERLGNMIKKSNSKKLSGKDVFELFDTYGFPADLTSLILKENKITIDDRLLRSEEKQSIFNLKNDIKHFFLSTEWNETYNDLNIPLHIQIVFEGLTQKGNQSIFSCQALFSNGEDLRYFDKSVQFYYSSGTNLYYDPVLFEPLSGFLAYYAHLIVAGMIDTYEFKGGNSHYEMARDIALRGSSSDYKKGWSSRITLVDNLDRNNGLRKARLAWYIAIDLFNENDISGTIEEVNLMLDGIEQSYRDLGRDFNTQYFLKANSKKIATLLADLNQSELLKDMKELDPDRREIYQSALEDKSE